MNLKLTIVGAGPGDPELITLKAVNALKCADVVLYDALVNPLILEHASKAICVYVGKKPGAHAFKQEDINQMIVDYALKYGHVVRLKGGDPFVFGRGAEEIQFAAENGLEVNIVSGISSATSVPANIGISPTLRHVSESMWILTGTTSAKKLSKDILLAAQSSATLVILMGMGKLKKIVTIFKSENKGKTAVAIIQNGTWKHERSVVGNINTIEKIVEEEEISSPAIIVIGEVVNYKFSSPKLLNTLFNLKEDSFHKNVPHIYKVPKGCVVER